jgi:hypothetical protein
LLIYQALKHRAENALDKVSEDYEQALTLFRQSGALLEKLQKLKVEHTTLSKGVIGQTEIEPADRVKGQIEKLKQARVHLKKLYGAIQKLKGENVPAELVDRKGISVMSHAPQLRQNCSM